MGQNKVQKAVYEILQRQQESVRFSITLSETDNLRLEKFVELMGLSKSAFCSELIVAALDDVEEMLDTPDSISNLSLPSAEEYIKAFTAIKESLTKKNQAMLKSHYKNGSTTTPELAKAAGYANYRAVNLQYARIGYMLAEQLHWSLPKHADGSPFPTAFVVDWNFNDVWYCTLHPQVTKALKITGLVR
ncbi:hypothetical protein [Nostoc sp. UHCC 0302]|uniref:hypothetical protein n=1 Tax=Nostoc sp. UHCC 0302 TaxID=3134896 RepID=UPI00311C9150